MLRLRSLVVLALSCFFSSNLTAQAPGTGLYPFGSFDYRGFDSINIGNLNVHFEIPIVSKPGRGQAFGYSLVYDGLVWAPVGSSGNQTWAADPGWGFHGQLNGQMTDGVVGYLHYNSVLSKCYDDPSNPGIFSWFQKHRTISTTMRLANSISSTIQPMNAPGQQQVMALQATVQGTGLTDLISTTVMEHASTFPGTTVRGLVPQPTLTET
jgi:hypothetical protein